MNQQEKRMLRREWFSAEPAKLSPEVQADVAAVKDALSRDAKQVGAYTVDYAVHSHPLPKVVALALDLSGGQVERVSLVTSDALLRLSGEHRLTRQEITALSADAVNTAIISAANGRAKDLAPVIPAMVAGVGGMFGPYLYTMSRHPDDVTRRGFLKSAAVGMAAGAGIATAGIRNERNDTLAQCLPVDAAALESANAKISAAWREKHPKPAERMY